MYSSCIELYCKYGIFAYLCVFYIIISYDVDIFLTDYPTKFVTLPRTTVCPAVRPSERPVAKGEGRIQVAIAIAQMQALVIFHITWAFLCMMALHCCCMRFLRDQNHFLLDDQNTFCIFLLDHENPTAPILLNGMHWSLLLFPMILDYLHVIPGDE